MRRSWCPRAHRRPRRQALDTLPQMKAAVRIAVIAAMAWLVSAPIAGLAATPATPAITLNVQTGPPGTTVTITGKGFPPQEIVAPYIDQAGPFLDVPGPRADDQGAITKSFPWPSRNYDPAGKVNPIVLGPHEVCGDTGYPGSTQPVAVKACAVFTV